MFIYAAGFFEDDVSTFLINRMMCRKCQIFYFFKVIFGFFSNFLFF